MGKLIHLNTVTGHIGPCRAGKRPCPLRGVGGEENHFTSAQEAREAYERIMTPTLAHLLREPRREASKAKGNRPPLKRLAAGALVLSFALAGCKTDISSKQSLDDARQQVSAAASQAATKVEEAAKEAEEAASQAASPTAPAEASQSTPSSSSTPSTYGPINVQQAASELDGLPTVDPTQQELTKMMDAYGRDKFVTSSQWDKARDKVYRAQFTNKTYKGSPAKGVVKTGDLADPYSGRLLHYERGGKKTIDVDHIVSLGNVWVSGGYLWSKNDARLRAIATDLDNLQAVSSSLNRQKGDDPINAWPQGAKPTPTGSTFQKTYLCAYADRQLQVKSEYKLTVTTDERGAYKAILTQCAATQGDAAPAFQH